MNILKIGGGAAINLDGIAEDLAEAADSYIVVHGANALRDELAGQLGREKRILTSVSGYSSVYSDESAIDLLMLAYAGLRNKRIVERLQRRGVDAVGLSGIDGRLIRGRRNKGIRVREGGKLLVVRDLSGKPQSVNRALLDLLLGSGYTPVLSVPIADEEGVAINSENDDIVTVLQEEVRADKVIHLIEAPGFLERPDDPDSRLPEITRADLARREGQVEGRMKRKMLAIRKLLEGGATTVVISDGRVDHPLRDALGGKGTVIR